MDWEKGNYRGIESEMNGKAKGEEVGGWFRLGWEVVQWGQGEGKTKNEIRSCKNTMDNKNKETRPDTRHKMRLVRV